MEIKMHLYLYKMKIEQKKEKKLRDTCLIVEINAT